MGTPKNFLQSISRAALKGVADAFASGFEALKGAPGAIREGFTAAGVGIRSADGPTRRMSVIFYLSLVGVGIVFYGFGKNALENRERARVARLAAETVAAEENAKRAEALRLREPPPYQSMGTFLLELREVDGVVRTASLRTAEFELVVACSEIDACEWIKANVDRARGELGSLFTPTDREKILSTGGKRAFREEIRDALNRLLEARSVKGTVSDVLFPRFIVN